MWHKIDNRQNSLYVLSKRGIEQIIFIYRYKLFPLYKYKSTYNPYSIIVYTTDKI